MTPPLKLAAFIELPSASPDAIGTALASLARPDRLGGMVSSALVHASSMDAEWPAGWVRADTESPTRACAWAFDRAATEEMALLIVTAGVEPSSDAIGALAEALEIDPLLGVAVPRFSGPGHRIQLLEPFGPGRETASRRVLAAQPEYRIVPECLAPCMLVRRELVANLAFTEGSSLWASLADYVIRARRAGFRPVLCNRVVVHLGADAGLPWGCEAGEVDAIRSARGEPVSAATPGVRGTGPEVLLGRAIDVPRSLLLDARNLTPTHNGTSAAIMGACDGLHRARTDADVTLWLHPDAADRHRVADRYAGWTIATTTPSRGFAAALRLSQPWAASDLQALRDLAAVNAFWMLDSIAWDVGHAAPPDLDDTWQRMAEDADALLFISEFSRQRFVNRFTVGAGVRTLACPLSLDAADYVRPFGQGPEPPYWMVMGNRYDHKHVGPTVDLLSRAFPTRRLVVIGDRSQPRAPGVIRFISGELTQDLVHACYGRADIVVFPSFYEGFGLPIVEGLSHGRTVVARDSPLVRELAARYRGPGRLCTYTTERELLERLGRLERGDLDGAIPLGTAGARWDWAAVGEMMLKTLDAVVAAVPSAQMLRRTGLARGLTHPFRARVD